MLVELRDVKYTYPSGEEVLKGVSFKINTTDPVAIIGQNGAGKTTTVKHLNGLLRPTSGEVIIDDIAIQKRKTAEWAKTIGYVFQNPDNQLFLDSVKKEFEFGPKQLKMPKHEITERLTWVAELMGLAHKLSVHPFDLTATEKKFCTIGSVLMMNPKIIIFDEPTCGQDCAGTKRLRTIIQEITKKNILCITISHDMKFVTENFERIIVMKKGKVILDGEKALVFKETEKLASSYVSPPPITRLGQLMGLNQLAFNADEFIKIVEEESIND
ncbi:energy-coupling factor ABC transporter ATP-binding protein [Enterococcus sp. LJL99]